eukprot:GFYU01010219.1.p1 GENE.GFYU01010219.1~~GFYU01010219.1.p1  ORF type:complete len:134 (+),score=33.95 GFYU01010219.1:49-402(+)
MSFATKLSLIKDMDGNVRDVMKTPKTDVSKRSLPGELKVLYNEQTKAPMTYPAESSAAGESATVTVYDKGPVPGVFSATFAELRERVNTQWSRTPKHGSSISDELRKKMDDIVASRT